MYKSYSELGKDYGLSSSYISAGFSKGLSIADIISKHRPRKVSDHLGNEYSSLSEMLKAWGIKNNTYWRRKEFGWSLEKILVTSVKDNQPNKNLTDFKGRVFPSLNAMCREYNVSSTTALYYVQKGMSPGDAIKYIISRKDNPSRVSDHLGNEFSSQKEMCEYWKVNATTFRNRKRKGWSLEEALTGKGGK